MPSTFFGLDIGTSGLYTYQAALNTTAHNSSNAETDGYSRQVLNQSAATPVSVYNTYGMVGTGVVGNSITQERNVYYDVKYRNNNSVYGSYMTKESYMTQIENYFNELKGNGLLANLGNFSNSLQELSKDTTSTAVRSQIAQYGNSITEYIQKIADNLNSLQKDANDEIRTSCQRVTALAEQIAMLTKQINTIEVRGQNANDLRDSRNLLVDELSQYANISVTERKVTNDDGEGSGRTTYVVKLNGQTLVDSIEYNGLIVKPRESQDHMNDADGLYEVFFANGQQLDLTSPTLGGKLQSLYEVRDGNNFMSFKGNETTVDGNVVTVKNTNMNDELLLNIPQSGAITLGNVEVKYSSFEMEVDANGSYTYKFNIVPNEKVDLPSLAGQKAAIGESVAYKGIPYYMSELNQYVRTLSQQINDIHRTGYNLKNETGIDFFSGVNKADNSEYTLHGQGEAITASNSYYSITASNFSVNSKIIEDPKAIATASSLTSGVENKDVLNKLINCMTDKSMFKEGTPTSFIQALISDIGVDTDKASNFSVSQSNILKAVDNQRLSISGVDVDEEAMNLVRFQNAYNLSAKVISIMDEIYDKLINYMGV